MVKKGISRDTRYHDLHRSQKVVILSKIANTDHHRSFRGFCFQISDKMSAIYRTQRAIITIIIDLYSQQIFTLLYFNS